MELNLDFDKSVNFKTPKINEYEIILDSINTLIIDCDSYLKLTTNGQLTMANGQLSQICEKFVLFIDIIRLMSIDSAQHIKSGLYSRSELKNQLSIFKALHTAVKSMDNRHIADLIEYELKDNLKRWKISLIQKALKS